MEVTNGKIRIKKRYPTLDGAYRIINIIRHPVKNNVCFISLQVTGIVNHYLK